MVRNLLAAIGFLCVALAGAAAVYATRWSYGPPERLAVSVRGLDLTDPEGRRLLDLRVDAAIDQVCESHGSFSMTRYDERDCRRKARLGAEPQINRAIDRAFDRRRFADDDTPIAPEGDYSAPVYAMPAEPEPRYIIGPAVEHVQPIDDSMRDRFVTAPVLRERHTTITRTALKPRVRWVKTDHGVVKKVVRRKLVRKTVKTVYTR